ncbi:MAG: four helix bundle protein [Bacteroidota bacterium]
MMALQTYKELEVWKRAMSLVEEIYKLTTLLPKVEQYGLKSQMQRAAVSIPANIAEGYGRANRKEYLLFLSYARASLMELETHLEIAIRVIPLKREQTALATSLMEEVGKMLTRLIQSLKTH